MDTWTPVPTVDEEVEYVQELLGRIAALDPEASLGIRVIACFDELIIGNVNTRALLSTAASLAGCPAGFSQDEPIRIVRMDPKGDPLDGAAPPKTSSHRMTDQARVWLEREGPPHSNDAIILERLALAVGVRLGLERHEIEPRRQLGIVLDAGVPQQFRLDAAAVLGLSPGRTYRVIAAPLFAVWATHPPGVGDVVPASSGPIHAVVVAAETDQVDVRPSGTGIATVIEDLPRSFRTAMVALRLCSPPAEPFINADRYGGLIELLADTGPHHASPDADRFDIVMAHPWAASTVDAIWQTSSIRQAARQDGVHHSTMQSRVDILTHELGFDPVEGYGRTRFGIAYLVWRLRTSRVLDLPTPNGAIPARPTSVV